MLLEKLWSGRGDRYVTGDMDHDVDTAQSGPSESMARGGSSRSKEESHDVALVSCPARLSLEGPTGIEPAPSVWKSDPGLALPVLAA